MKIFNFFSVCIETIFVEFRIDMYNFESENFTRRKTIEREFRSRRTYE